MKKFLAFATLASVALVGCVNDEKMEMTSGAQKISFDTPVMSTQTRAVNEFGEVDGATYPTTEQFVVYAKQHRDGFNGWETGTADFWTNTGLKVTYDAAVGGGSWDTDEDYYWPEAPYQLTFAAYSPADCSGTKSYGATGLTITDFESPETVASQYDLMYSDRSKNNNEGTHADAGAPITFKHALSSIVFAAVNLDSKMTYEITSLTLTSAKWGVKATFTQGITETAASGSTPYSENENPSWTTPTVGTVNYTMYSGSTFTVPETNYKHFTGSTSIVGKNTAILAIPQNVPDDAKLTIVYNQIPNTTGTSRQDNITKEVLLSEFEQADGVGTPISSWVVNGRYTYVFSFGPGKKIFFKPTVTDWKEEATAYITINDK